MAFNPFKAFQKHRKYWMAAILLMCMITFVLLSNTELMTWFLQAFSSGREGPVLVQIDGHQYRSGDMDRLKTRRVIAQEFMGKLLDHAILRFKNILEEERKTREESDKKGGEDVQRRAMELARFEAWRQDLVDRRSQPRYFETGTRLDDLSNFLVWLHIADKKDIRLRFEDLQTLVKDSIHGRQIGLDSQATAGILREIQVAHYGVTEDEIYKALTDEFRVQIAKLASLECRSLLLLIGGPQPERGSNPEQLVLTGSLPVQTRLPLTPEQMFSYYNKTRTETNLEVLPITVEEFAKQVATPTEAQLTKFFEAHAKVPYDPASEKPGFKFPPKVRIGYLIADPDAPTFKKAARAVTALLSAPIPGSVVPLPGQPLPLAVWGVSRPAAFEASLQRDYESLTKAGRPGWKKHYFPAWPTPHAALHYLIGEFENPTTEGETKDKDVEKAKKPALDPALVAGLVAGFANPIVLGPGGTGNAQVTARFIPLDRMARAQAKKVAPLIAADTEERARLATRLVGLCAPGDLARLSLSDLPPAALGGLIDPKTELIRLESGNTLLLRRPPMTDEYRDKLRQERVEQKLAQVWANNIMLAVEQELDKAKSNQENFKRLVVPNLLEKYAGFLEYRETQELYHKYNIANAPELSDLRDEFEKSLFRINSAEGRSGTPRQLKDDDFHKLFFEGEAFSIFNSAKFFPKPWPPRVTEKRNTFDAPRPGEREKVIDFFKDASRPILYWRVDDDTEKVAESLAQVRPEVEKAWKMHEASKNIMDRVKSVTTALLKADKEKSLATAIVQQSKELGRPSFEFTRVAPLVPLAPEFRKGGRITYAPFELPRGRLEYPREDTLKHLLALAHLKEPIKIGDAPLDDLNKQLFDNRDQDFLGHTMQVLTNKPRTAYYVVMVPNNLAFMEKERPILHVQAFKDSWRSQMQDGADPFIDHCQTELGKEYRQLFIEQMGMIYNRTILESDARSRFDTDGPGK